MLNNKFYVYAHRRKDDGTIAYVGKGSGKRAWVKYGRSDLWTRISKKHGFDVEILHSYLTEYQAFDLERQAIAAHNPACNFTDGGEGISGYRHTPETRAALQRAHAGKAQPGEVVERRAAILRGKKRTAEFGKAVSDRMRGRKASDETRAKMSAAHTGSPRPASAITQTAEWHRGRKRSAEARQRMADAQPKRSVVCLNTGTRFESITSAVEWVRSQGASKATKTGIWRVAIGRSQTAYGFRWAYADTNS